MLEYRAYLIGRDGNVLHRVDITCVNDAAAEDRARLLVDIHTVELWQGARNPQAFAKAPVARFRVARRRRLFFSLLSVDRVHLLKNARTPSADPWSKSKLSA